MTMRVAITGAGGFLGAALARRLTAAGVDVQAWSRRDPLLPGVHWQAYDLSRPAPEQLAEATIIVHAAFAMGRASPALEQLNLSAAQSLLALARRQRRSVVFISSMSAHAEARSSYGRAKYSIEQLLDLDTDTIVRPGLIIGPGGVYARMLDSLRRAPIVPLFFGGRQPVQPIALDDLLMGLQRIVERKLTGEFNLGSVNPISVRELYRRMLAAAGCRRPILPLPGDLTLATLRVVERLGLSLPLTAENLVGQKHLRTFATMDSLQRLNLYPVPLDDMPWVQPTSRP